MKYVSTRSRGYAVSSAEAIRIGLAPDGGLYMPDAFPKIDGKFLKEISALPYSDRAARIMHLFLSDSYSLDEIAEDCSAAYSETSFPGGPAPVKKTGSLNILELWHGPTSAFKDMALQVMPRLFVRAVRKTGDGRRALILVATSGDTGKAALEGYRDVEGVEIAVYYPVDGVSEIQKLQMATQTGSNVRVRSVRGNFDDAQTGVKKIFSDPSIAETLDRRGYFLSSANSINWGRLVPQICYYFSAYCDLINDGTLKNGETLDVTVPTGNFGNILAAYIAKKCGLPLGRLICASNSNRVLTDFFSTGKYDKNRRFILTSSPSMDILVSSNLERLLYVAAGHKKTAEYMSRLSSEGRYVVDSDVHDALCRDFNGECRSEQEVFGTIRTAYEKYGYLLDTHTAVAYGCAEKYALRTSMPMLVISTASPFKFSPSVLSALGKSPCNEEEAAEKLSECTGVEIPYPLRGLTGRPVIFPPEDSIAPAEMPDDVLSNLRY